MNIKFIVRLGHVIITWPSAQHQSCEFVLSTNGVRTGPGQPRKSWNFIVAFSRAGKCWKKAAGPGKFWISAKLK